MKHKVLGVISCVMLSAMLMAEVALPTQAAVNACETHVVNNGTKKVLGYPNADYTCHQVKASIAGICSECKNPVTVIITYTEPHTLQQNGVCVCGYKPH
ncbi:MAG: hypothetical protein NC543_12035 [bacterium]|nr:hypothetical protein [bacterium]MCM1376091.1 hypothetical protein [Muribaculum sp.]